jgi:hypothetical protein
MAKKPAPKPTPPTFKVEGVFVRQTLIREYKQKGHSDQDAITFFNACVANGSIVVVRVWNGINIFEFKK